MGPGQHLLQRRPLNQIGFGTGLLPRQRRLRHIVPAHQSRSAALLALSLHRGLEEILEQLQLGIQGLERLLRRPRVVPIPAHELAHRCPVLLFNKIFHAARWSRCHMRYSCFDRYAIPPPSIRPLLRPCPMQGWMVRFPNGATICRPVRF